ncbi:adenylyl-sulfate kinase [Actinoplanes sp. NBC_00393]|uniref:adenylyl-sulfate kinase n=1 Tax=Actinoplanes sp. NBC_00393 TaxID=2975953 RepID=UPI002E1D0047
MTEIPVRALLITGTVGSGKTSAAEALGDLLAAQGIPHAVLDVDWLRRAWPAPPGDPFNGAITLRNLRAVAANFVEAGARRLILAGVIESRAERASYQDALGVPLQVCRLHVGLPVVRERLRRRNPDEPWFLDRAAELDHILTREKLEDILIDATSGTPTDVAAAVYKATAW